MKTAAAGTGQKLYERARKLIPGGTQLLSKRPEMFLPGEWPAYYARARGAETWDLDGNHYIDVSHSGVGACVLGFADPDVNEAVFEAIRAGTMSTLNCPEEVELAELLLELHPWAEMARFCRGGGEAMAMAARIARAATGRDKIAFCGYHGWHDWYLAANLAEDHALDGHLLAGLEPAGVPRGLTGTMLPFHYNRIEELRAIVSQHGRDLAAIVMEPTRDDGPAPGFLEEIRDISSRVGAVLVFDEVTSGWRMNTGGIHRTYGVDPDMAVFAKGMGNGYAMAAVIGVRPVMESSQTTFISSTYWTEKIGPVAALATIRKHRARDVSKHLIAVGERVQVGWRKAADTAGLSIDVGGIAPLSHFSLPGKDGLALLTLFTQELLERGFLASGQFYASYAHQPHHIEAYLSAVGDVFMILSRAAAAGDVARLLRGPVKHSGFQRLT
ncbi:MAG TPA: aminotransferase class III-fold pyridoxal phosphate-dependent enzyme [Candidatus Limnocylindria bacterium]|jgi:glutamate-1-semialdehyde aminotransferase|nr:aminotransferase class III-fold pyridoxal phosphate-dependent enzyme [Candidatus Limnocylindria bacterium]